MYIANYREVLKNCTINNLLEILNNIESLEEAYRNDSYISREIEQAQEVRDDLEQAIEYIINIEYNLRELL